MLADEVDYVIGVDPHRDTCALGFVQAKTGGVTFEAEIRANEAGYRKALSLAVRHAPDRRAWAIEGTGSYGSGLARFLHGSGERVLEIGRVKRESRSQPKTDAIDAGRAARSALGKKRQSHPRSYGEREALRALVATREGALRAKRAGLCQLRALIVSCPEPLRSSLAPLTRARLLARLARLRPDSRGDLELRGTLISLRALALRVQTLTREERELKREIAQLVRKLAPSLVREVGVGPISAASVFMAWSHSGRIRNEAAFARLAGVAPVPASSGQVVRQRLDHGGDRKLNCALHQIIVSRKKVHPETIAYVERRISEGKSKREAMRCLKRYLARHLFRVLEEMPLGA